MNAPRVLTYPEIGERSTQLAGELVRKGHEATRKHDVIKIAADVVRVLPSGRVCVWLARRREECMDLDWTDAADVALKVLAVL